MTPLAPWLDERSPTPPDDLPRRIAEALTEASEAGRPVPGASDKAVRGDVTDREGEDVNRLARPLLATAVDRLNAARAAPGRIRESAFDLLVADALITYACEAALEADRPLDLLHELLDVGGRG